MSVLSLTSALTEEMTAYSWLPGGRVAAGSSMNCMLRSELLANETVERIVIFGKSKGLSGSKR